MRRYKPFLKEDANDNANDLANEIIEEIKKIFPKSYVSGGFSSNIYPSIHITFALGANKSEWSNGYLENDPAHNTFMIHGQRDENDLNDSGQITGLLVCESKNTGFYIKSASSFKVYDRVKVPFRKVTGNSQKIIEAFKKYFIALKKSLQENRDNINEDHLKRIGDKF